MTGSMKRMGNEKGSSFPLAAAVTLALLLLLCGVAELLRVSLIAAGVREAMRDAVTVVVNDNYANVYHGVREGYSGGYVSDGAGFEAAVDDGDIYYELDRVLGTRPEGGAHVKEAQGAAEYRITGLSVTVRNAPLAPADPRNAQRFEADAEVSLEIPLHFAGREFPPVRTRLKVQAGYTEVF